MRSRSTAPAGLALLVLLLATLVLPAAALAAVPAAAADVFAWNPQDSLIDTSLAGVSFPDTRHGWAVGENGTILATADGGAHWTAQGSATTEVLLAVCFPDALNGWAVGSAGTILATADGGAHWDPQVSGTTVSLYAVSFPDAVHGWAVGDAGTILATTDGGAHWNLQASGTAAGLTGVTFADASHGWAVGGLGTILATADGGAHWSLQDSRTGVGLAGVSFADATHGWAVGGNVVLATVDGGVTWIRQAVDSVRYPLYGVACVDANHAWVAAGRVLSDAVVYGTTDGGATWFYEYVPTWGYLRGIAFADADHGWVVGSRGRIFATTSGGRPPAATCTVTPSVVGGPAGHGTISPSTPQTLPAGSQPVFTFRPDAGYAIRAVLVDGARVGLTLPNAYAFPPLTADHTISVEFAPLRFTITSAAGRGGTIDPAGTVGLTWGGAQSYAVRAEAGFHIADVRVDGRSLGAVASYAFTNVTASHTIAASFAPDAFTITALVGASGHGTVTPSGTSLVLLGATPTYLFTPQRGYYASRLTLDGVPVAFTAPNRYTFAPVTGSHVLQVFFTAAVR